MLCKFPINSTPATILFDSGASHTFISTKFVKENHLPTIHLENPILAKTPGAKIPCQLQSPEVKIILSGIEFTANRIVLNSGGIDLIHGMDWFKKHKGQIDCEKGKITLTNSDGRIIECQTQTKHTAPMICAMEVTSSDQVPIVREFPDVFPEELLGLPLDRDVEFIIDLIPCTSPIAKRPYRIPVNALS